VYVNTRPQPQEVARPLPAQGDVLVINAFVRIALTDANAPSDVTPARERRASSPLVEFNHAAAVALQHAINCQ
jgi:methyl coenzyme M reductase alpha subunit